MQLVSLAHRRDEDVFQVVPVSPLEVRDLDFVNDVCDVLKDFLDKMKRRALKLDDRRYVYHTIYFPTIKRLLSQNNFKIIISLD